MSWPLVKLSEVTEVNPRLPKNIDENQKVSFVGMASASEDGFLLHEDVRILSETKKGFTYFDKSDVLLAKITPCFENGKCLRPNQITNKIGFGSTEFHVLRAIPEKIDSTYLFYMVWNNQFRWLGEASMSGAAGQKRVSTDFLKGFEIPLPPLAEQKRITAILDKADAIRRKRQQAIKLADDFLRAVFMDMFGDPVTNPKGWKVKKLGDVAELINGDRSSNYPSGDDLKKSGILFLNTKNITNGVIELIDPVFITGEKFNALSRGKLQRNDLVITLRGTLGSCAIFNTEYEAGFINAQLMIIRPKMNMTSDFLHAFLTSNQIQDIFQSLGRGAAVPQLTGSQMKDFDIYIPDADMLCKFTKIKAANNEVKVRSNAADKAKLIESISQKLFSGQL